MTLVVGGSFQNKYEWAQQRYDEKFIWNDFHLFVKSQLENGRSAEEIQASVDKRLRENPETVIISDELGCGIVPFDPKDREYRELTGRLLCNIAEKSDNVYRIVCGIGQKIK